MLWCFLEIFSAAVYNDLCLARMFCFHMSGGVTVMLFCLSSYDLLVLSVIAVVEVLCCLLANSWSIVVSHAYAGACCSDFRICSVILYMFCLMRVVAFS